MRLGNLSAAESAAFVPQPITITAKPIVPTPTVLTSAAPKGTNFLDFLSNTVQELPNMLALYNQQRIANLNIKALKAGQSPVGDLTDVYGATVKKYLLYGALGLGGFMVLNSVLKSRRRRR